jgi:hypothetical protein
VGRTSLHGEPRLLRTGVFDSSILLRNDSVQAMLGQVGLSRGPMGEGHVVGCFADKFDQDLITRLSGLRVGVYILCAELYTSVWVRW